MGTIEKVLKSNQNLAVDERMDISIGTVELPKGSGGNHLRITKVNRKNNSLDLKKSEVTIENKDQLCISIAIWVGWGKLKRCTPEELAEITKTEGINRISNSPLNTKKSQLPITKRSSKRQ